VRVISQELNDATEFTSGAAPGVDTTFALTAWNLFPDAVHRLIVPAAPHNDALVDWAEEKGFEIVHAPRKADDASSFMARNDMLVSGEYADVLVAFPFTEEEILRSGTWSTIRRARRLGKEVRLRALAAEG
jgi:hypothetical protein